MGATSPPARKRIQLMVTHMRSAMRRLIVETMRVARVVDVSATGTEKKTGQIAAQKKVHCSANDIAGPQENANVANASASTPKTDSLTVAATIVSFQEVFARMALAPVTVGLASGPTAARRIAGGQEEIAGMGNAPARQLARRVSGLTAVRRIVGQVGSVWRASVSANTKTRIGQIVVRKIASLNKAGSAISLHIFGQPGLFSIVIFEHNFF